MTTIDQDIAMYEASDIIKRSADRVKEYEAADAKRRKQDNVAYVVLTVGLMVLVVWAFKAIETTTARDARVMQEASVKW